MGYKYDVFISYSRDTVDVETWVHNFFYKMFCNKLQAISKEDPKIFIDKSSIQTGDDWESTIEEALSKSRLIICLYVPKYFTSKWCLKEYHAFSERRKYLKDKGESDNIVWPIQLADGDHNPDFATKEQFQKFHDFFHTCKGFDQTADFLEFEKTVKKMAEDIEIRLRNIPEWQSEWESAEWWERIDSKIELSNQDFSKPKI